MRAGSFEAVLQDRRTSEQGLRAARECLQVVARRGGDLKEYPETKMYMSTSPAAMWISGPTIKMLFCYNKLVQRSSAHRLEDVEEVKAFYYDLLGMDRQLGVDMPAMCAFETDILRFEKAA